MKVVDGKIKEISESELFDYWLNRFSDIYSYIEYKNSMINHGVVIKNEDEKE